MLLRGLVVVVVAACAVASSGGDARAAQRPEPLTLILTQGKTAADLRTDPLLSNIAREGAVALLSTRTLNNQPHPHTRVPNALLTLGGGARGAIHPEDRTVERSGAFVQGLLGLVLERAGLRAAVATEPHRVRRFSDQVLGGRSTQSSAGAQPVDLLVIDALTSALPDRVDGRVIVVSIAVNDERYESGIRLSVVAARGLGRGLLSSGTTRRPGVITLTDIAPTVIEMLGAEVPAEMEGRSATVVAGADPVGAVEDLESGVIRAANSRQTVARVALIVPMLLAAASLALVLAGRGRAGRGARRALACGLAGAAAMPLAAFVGAVLPAWLPVWVWVVAIGAVCAALARMWGARRVLAGVCVLTVAVPLADLLAGQPIGVRSPWSFLLSVGARFYGVGEELLGIVVGAQLVGTALLLDRARDQRRAVVAAAVGFAAVTWLLGSPTYGAKFGAALTAVPAFGVLAVAIGNRRLNPARIAAIAAATVAVTALLVVVDRLRADEARTHVARVIGGSTDAWSVIERKLRATLGITLHTIWPKALVVFGGALAFLRLRRRDILDRGIWGEPLLRASVLACTVGAVAAIVFNDGGVVAAGPMMLYPATAVTVRLLG